VVTDLHDFDNPGDYQWFDIDEVIMVNFDTKSVLIFFIKHLLLHILTIILLGQYLNVVCRFSLYKHDIC